MVEYNLTNSELAILSLIAERPRHGYELEQVIEERGMRAWREIAFSSIYFVLARLVKQGLAAAALQPAAGRGPAKKVFSATKPGHDALREGIRQALATSEPGGQRFLLGLSCLPLLGSAEIHTALQERITTFDAKIKQLAAHPALSQPGFPAHVSAMFNYSLSQLRAERDWSQNFINSYQEGEIQHG